MSEIRIAGGKYALKGTNGKSPVWVPIWNRYVDLNRISSAEAAELIEMKFPFIKELEAEESEDSTPESLSKLKLSELKQLAGEKGLPEESFKDLTKKDEVIKLLIA
ncbi:MAG: hypothetical protein NXI00_10975 [Cytophagales bacterium]|nr:hypothetical protein [Cytophagales bacterium]